MKNKKTNHVQLDLPLLANEKSDLARPQLSTVSKSPLVPTVAFDTYWRFAAERQNIFFKRAAGQPTPWTDDRILSRFRFTNVYRASDRVSQYLISKVQYLGAQDAPSLFFRTILFKLFNRIETWDLLKNTNGEPSPDRNFERLYERVLDDAMKAGKTIYSGAYIMPSGTGTYAYERKHHSHLAILSKMMNDDFPERMRTCRTMEQAFRLLRSVPTFGDFLAYQYVIDLNYSTLTNFDESEFVMPGPGARSGIRKCFKQTGSYNESDIIRWMVDHQEEEFAARGITFQSLWGRRLQLIDCQNLFCEVDKYCRIYHPEIQGLSDRTRIKQEYQQNRTPLTLWFPPKWNLNPATQQ
jgi:hypothetical protein